MRKFGILVGVLLVLFLSFLGYFFLNPIKIETLSYSELNPDNSKTLTIKFKNGLLNPSCKINNENLSINNNSCSADVIDGNYNITINNLLTSDTKTIQVSINDISKITLNTHDFYLAPDEEYTLRPNIETIGTVEDKTLEWTSDNKSIVEVDNGKIIGKGIGTTTIKASAKNGISDETKVTVTDIIRKPELDDTKKKVPCNAYTEEEAELLDKILASRIDAEEEGSRAAMLATIRFITLNFKYKIPYFFEHGRLNNYSGQRYVDGEGRYYHKGLYLSESKFKDLKAINSGPAIWGCGLTNYDGSYGWTVGAKYPNGLDCSGFVTWAMLNSGHDVGDIGSGFNPNAPDMSDVGEMHQLTYKFANDRNYKPGDIIARDGHTALIAGIDDNYIYIAESLLKGVRINKQSYTNPNSDLYKNYSYINTLDKFYSSDGTYEDLWN